MVIHVRPITNEEGNRLSSIVRHGKDPIEMRRAQVILASAQGFTPPKIGNIVLMTPGYVRTLIQPSWLQDAQARLEARREQEIHRRRET
ncbi:MAG: hypothetical protein ACREBQ_04820 [Nitrososphaerales archaeon]